MMLLDGHKGFVDDRFYLSNFYTGAPFVDVFGNQWKTSEHYFMAHKALCEEDFEKVRNAKTPNDAKLIGRRIQLRNDWECGVRDEVMRQALLLKFLQNPNIALKLVETEDEELIEYNTWHDNYWGKCVCERCESQGYNQLGKLLMELRVQLKSNKYWE